MRFSTIIKSSSLNAVTLGVLFGLFFSSHALKGVLHVDFHKFLVVVLLVVLAIFLAMSFKKLPKLKKLSALHLGLSSCLILYMAFQLIIGASAYKFIELVSIIFLLAIPLIIIDKQLFISTIKNVSLFSVVTQSIFLIVNKPYVWSFPHNYLLVAVLSPVVLCYSYYMAWSTSSRPSRIFYLILTIIVAIALLKVQSRFSLLLGFLGIAILSVYLLRRIISTFEGWVFISISIYSFSEIIRFIEQAPATKRLVSLIASEISFDRIIILKLYISELSDKWFTGFGLGQTPTFPPYYYPHNFIVEFVTEFGVIGGIFILTISVTAIIRLFQLKLKNPNSVFVFFISINYILFFLKSGTIYDSYSLFAVFGLIFFTTSDDKEEINPAT